MKILGNEVIKAFPKQIINIHPSLLPSFPGLNAQKQALNYGVKYSGCTVHFVDNTLDGGPIILQSLVEIKQDDTEESLTAKIIKQEHQLLPKAVQLFAEKKLYLEDRKILIK